MLPQLNSETKVKGEGEEGGKRGEGGEGGKGILLGEPKVGRGGKEVEEGGEKEMEK